MEGGTAGSLYKLLPAIPASNPRSVLDIGLPAFCPLLPALPAFGNKQQFVVSAGPADLSPDYARRLVGEQAGHGILHPGP